MTCPDPHDRNDARDAKLMAWPEPDDATVIDLLREQWDEDHPGESWRNR